MRSGRRPVSRASSATRAERFEERTAEKVASASTSVPPAVAKEEMVVQLATRGHASDRARSGIEARVIDLGAHLRLDRTDDAEEPFRVDADPPGHPLCIFVTNG